MEVDLTPGLHLPLLNLDFMSWKILRAALD